ncbi:MAG TPA: hypothetical protein VMS17_14080, partial [Gemmataceae bacterium]|nr:hypothetical protein [Gemmataceae bacterium]
TPDPATAQQAALMRAVRTFPKTGATSVTQALFAAVGRPRPGQGVDQIVHLVLQAMPNTDDALVLDALSDIITALAPQLAPADAYTAVRWAQ